MASNPFEVRGNKRLRFDILGRRVTGAKRDVAAARTDAYARRSATLLPELDTAGKRNTFSDRRFGEGDPGVDDETKALVRFQKERMRQLGASKRSRKFKLDEGGGGDGSALLTHGGRSLDELGELGAPPEGFGDSEEDNGVLDAGVHFGGGEEDPAHQWRGRVVLPAWASAGGAQAAAAPLDPNRRRSHKEIMEEVMAKSKAAKAARAEESQEHTALLESLDSKLEAVSALLAVQEARNNKGRMAAAAAATAPSADAAAAAALAVGGSARGHDRASRATAIAQAMRQGGGTSSAPAAAPAFKQDDFDSLVHSLSRSSRTVGASDRTKSAEELAQEEAGRLKELEELRVARMRGGAVSERGDGKQKRRRGRGEEEEDKLGEGGREGGSGELAAKASAMLSGDDLGPMVSTGALTIRQKRRQLSGSNVFDNAADALAARGSQKSSDKKEEEEEDDDDYEEEEEDDDGDEEDEEDDEEEYSSIDSEGDDVFEVSTRSHAGDEGEGASSEEEEEEKDEESAKVEDEFPDLPFTLALPSSVAEWNRLVKTYAEPFARSNRADEAQQVVSEMLKRLRTLNAVALKPSNRDSLASLYSILLRALGDVTGNESSATLAPKLPPVWRTQPLQCALYEMSLEVPLQAPAAAAWREAVQAFSSRVSITAPPSWPTYGEFLLCQTGIKIFPTTDLRHAILTPLLLTLAQCLTQCPVSSPLDLCKGVAVASQVLGLTFQGRRYSPECAGFLGSVLTLFATSSTFFSSSLTSSPGSDLPPLLPTFSPLLAFLKASPEPFHALMSSPVSSLPPLLPGSALFPPSSVRYSPAALLGFALGATLPCLCALGDILCPPAFLQCSSSSSSSSSGGGASSSTVASSLMQQQHPCFADLQAAAIEPSGSASFRVGGGMRREGGGGAAPLVPLSGTLTPFAPSPEILDPLCSALARIAASVSTAAKGTVVATLKALVAARDACGLGRQALRVHASSGPPAKLSMHTPLLEEVGKFGGWGGGGKLPEKGTAEEEAARARKELRALQKAAKREKRGAVRELRQDRSFVVREVDRKARVRDGERAAVTRGLMSELETLQANFNLQVGKKKSKPLAKDDPARLPAHLAWKSTREFGKTKADRRARKEGVGGDAGRQEGGKKAKRRESKGPHKD